MSKLTPVKYGVITGFFVALGISIIRTYFFWADALAHYPLPVSIIGVIQTAAPEVFREIWLPWLIWGIVFTLIAYLYNRIAKRKGNLQ